MLATDYTLKQTSRQTFVDAVERVRAELAAEGFGVLCEIDVAATLKAKLGVTRDPYLILGACNPPYAHRALEAEPDLGTLLPCNVAVYEHQGATTIAAVDPVRLLGIVGNDALVPVAEEIRERLAAVVDRAAA